MSPSKPEVVPKVVQPRDLAPIDKPVHLSDSDDSFMSVHSSDMDSLERALERDEIDADEEEVPPLTAEEIADFQAFKAAYNARLAAAAAAGGAPSHVQRAGATRIDK